MQGTARPNILWPMYICLLLVRDTFAVARVLPIMYCLYVRLIGEVRAASFCKPRYVPIRFEGVAAVERYNRRRVANSTKLLSGEKLLIYEYYLYIMMTTTTIIINVYMVGFYISE